VKGLKQRAQELLHTVLYNTVLYAHCSTVPYKIIQYYTFQCSAVRSATVSVSRIGCLGGVVHPGM